MTIKNRKFVEVEAGYFMCDLGYCVLYVVARAGGWTWERLHRVCGELVDDDSTSGQTKRRHHAGYSAIRSIPLFLDYLHNGAFVAPRAIEVEFQTADGYVGSQSIQPHNRRSTFDVLGCLRELGFYYVTRFRTYDAQSGLTISTYINPVYSF